MRSYSELASPSINPNYHRLNRADGEQSRLTNARHYSSSPIEPVAEHLDCDSHHRRVGKTRTMP